MVEDGGAVEEDGQRDGDEAGVVDADVLVDARERVGGVVLPTRFAGENKLATCVGECSAPWENLVEGISVVGRWHASGHRGWAAADAGRCALLQPLP